MSWYFAIQKDPYSGDAQPALAKKARFHASCFRGPSTHRHNYHLHYAPPSPFFLTPLSHHSPLLLFILTFSLYLCYPFSRSHFSLLPQLLPPFLFLRCLYWLADIDCSSMTCRSPQPHRFPAPLRHHAPATGPYSPVIPPERNPEMQLQDRLPFVQISL